MSRFEFGIMWVAVLIMMPQRLIIIVRMKCAFRLTRRVALPVVVSLQRHNAADHIVPTVH